MIYRAFRCRKCMSKMIQVLFHTRNVEQLGLFGLEKRRLRSVMIGDFKYLNDYGRERKYIVSNSRAIPRAFTMISTLFCNPNE